MAKEEIENAEESQDGKKPAGKKKFPIMLIIIVVVVILLGVGGFIGFSKYKSGQDKKKADEAGMLSENGDLSALPMVAVGPIYSIVPPFTVNLAEARGRRYLKVSVDLELESEAIRTEITNRLPQIRDAVIVLLSNKNLEDVNSNEGINKIKTEMKTRIEAYLKKGAIKNIYFSEFLIQ